jgi:hypothetical protein
MMSLDIVYAARAVIQFLPSTYIGCWFREIPYEDNAQGGLQIPKLGHWNIMYCLEQLYDSFWKLCMYLDCIVIFVLGFCFFLFLYFFL